MDNIMNNPEEKELQRTLSEEELSKALTTARLITLVTNMSEEEQKSLLKELEGKNLKKTRKHPRKSFTISVDYVAQDRVYRDMIQSISASGLFIETRKPFLVGQEIRLVLTLPGYDRPIKLNCQVVRTNQQGVGVTFKQVTPYMEELLKKIVDKL